MNFPPRFIDEIRARLPLSEIIGRKVKVTRAGREFKACCPFHKEKTPSFTINDDKQFYHCFGCGAHGDVVGFTMQYENLSFPEAVEQLASLAGLEMPQQSPEEVQRARKEKDLYQLMEDAARYFEDQLSELKHQAAWKYIRERGLAEETLSAFRVGYAPEDRRALYQVLNKLGYTDNQMIEAGLIRTDKHAKPYSFFRERIMFPVADRRGRIVAFGGRILPDHLRTPDHGDFVPPKYINSIDTPLFHKGRMLYGAAHADYAARQAERLIVVEGYLDVIACWQAGFRGTVAPLGTALTEDQIAHLWRMIPGDEKVPVLCFDGDEAGRRAAQRAVERLLPLLKPGHSTEIVFLPEGEDPDTLLHHHGKQAFQHLLDQALPLVSFVFQSETEGKSFDTPEQCAALSARLEEQISLIPDRNLQYHYRTALRDKTREFLRSAYPYSSAYKYPSTAHCSDVAMKRPQDPQDHLIKRIMMAAVITHPALFYEVEERLGLLYLEHQALSRLRENIFPLLTEENNLDFESLKSHLISVGLEAELAYTVNDSVFTHAGFGLKSEISVVLEKWNSFWNILERLAEKSDQTTLYHQQKINEN